MSLACNVSWRRRPAGVFAMCTDLKKFQKQLQTAPPCVNKFPPITGNQMS
jgi:hypothetical protein